MKNMIYVTTVLAVGGISFAASGASAKDFMSERDAVAVERTTIFDALAANKQASAEAAVNKSEDKPVAVQKKQPTRSAKSAAPKTASSQKSASRAKAAQSAKSETITRKSDNGYALPGVGVERAAAAKPRLKAVAKVGSSPYSEIITRYAGQYGVPVNLAHAVVRVESNFNPKALGAAGEIGLMQIKPATARSIGFSGSNAALYDPETNIRFGMKYLAMAHELGGGSTCGTILKYNAGHGAKRMNPVSARYCSKVKVHLASF